MENNNIEQPKIHATVEWMSSMYDKMNKELFGGMLGGCTFNVFTTGKGSQGGTLGWFKVKGSGIRVERSSRRLFLNTIYGREYINENNFVNYCKPQIELNGNYTATEEGFLATLVHEMCHYYTYMKGLCPRQGHGPEFYAIGRTVSARSNGRFTIQRLATAEEMKEWQLSDEMQAKKDKRIANKKSNMTAVFVFNSNGTIELSTTTSKDLVYNIIDYIKKSVGSPSRGVPQKIVTSNDEGLINMLFENGYRRSFRTYRYWNVENKPWVNSLDNYDVNVVWSNMKENKETKKIVENILHNFLKEEFGIEDDSISIDPNMNLGLESPLEVV